MCTDADNIQELALRRTNPAQELTLARKNLTDFRKTFSAAFREAFRLCPFGGAAAAGSNSCEWMQKQHCITDMKHLPTKEHLQQSIKAVYT